MAEMLTREIASVDGRFSFTVNHLGAAPPALKLIARKLQYDPDFTQHHNAWQFKFTSPAEQTVLVISFHGIGASYRGILAASAYCQVAGNEPVAISDDVFRISYEENPDEVARRFEAWLESCSVTGIAIWRRSLV